MSTPAPRPILEIGHLPYLKQIWPERVCFVSVGVAAPHPAADLAIGGAQALLAAPALARLLRAPETALVACRIHHHPARSWALARRLILRARGPGAPPLVVLDFEDEDFVNAAHRPLLEAAALVFKRELPVDRWRLLRPVGDRSIREAPRRADPAARALLEKFRPLALGLPLREQRHAIPAGPVPKTADLFFAGAVAGQAWPRETGRAELEGLKAEGLRLDLPAERLEPAAFYRRCAASWLTWSPAGLGWDCFRHYEAAACGSVPLMPYPWIERQDPLVDGEHAILYDPRPGGLAAAVRAALTDRGRLARMAEGARAQAWAYHRPEAIAARIVRLALGRAGAGEATDS